MMQNIYSFILRRSFFRGQDRIFNYLFSHNRLKKEVIVRKPIEGNFHINCDTSTWIGGKIAYTGEYERDLKKVFKFIIKEGDHVLDVGANIGFHTLYFAELTGKKGSVTAFEPVPHNYQALKTNIKLNNYANIITHNIALSNKDEQFCIKADIQSTNPGAYNLFEQNGDISIKCGIGDAVIGSQRVDFIKIDVEGYESFVLDGLLETIKKNKPKIIFEYDQHYHQKTGRSADYIFSLLVSVGYHFKYIHRDGLRDLENITSGNILALPNE
ncbi:FkbM family methyltransferase [Pedobacter sp.]|uniref:FkbM family methyltransferase n=1 Tax=Pedobacter sp. TaxID=1411316 RepID=UPI003C578418